MQLALDQSTIIILGGGKMGEALLAGWIASEKEPAKSLTAQCFTVVEPSAERRSYLSETYGVTCVDELQKIVDADMVLLALKPQVILSILEKLTQNDLLSNSSLFISVAAGLTTEKLQTALPAQARLVRTMPNTPLLVGEGATAVCGSNTSRESDVGYVQSLFACLGSAVVVDEKDMDVVCAVSGSGPAYVCAMIEAVREAGVAQGLSADVAEKLFVQTVRGTACLLQTTEQTPEQVREAVSSPGGTTIAGLAAMEEAGLVDVYAQGVGAAAVRSKELGEC